MRPSRGLTKYEVLIHQAFGNCLRGRKNIISHFLKIQKIQKWCKVGKLLDQSAEKSFWSQNTFCGVTLDNARANEPCSSSAQEAVYYALCSVS